MVNDIYSFALKSTLSEIRNLCPGIMNSFVFKKNGEIMAGDESTTEKTLVRAAHSLDDMMEKADAVGGIDNITLEGSKGRVNISCMNDLYLVTVTSEDADNNYINTITRVLSQSVLKLLEKIAPTPLKTNVSRPLTPLEVPVIEDAERRVTESSMRTEEIMTEEREQPQESEVRSERALREPPVNQFIVEDAKGLFKHEDTVHIDKETILQWEELYEDKKIEEIEIETFCGKALQCKVKPIKSSKHEGKGVIQIPERIQILLEVKKGELVRAKPKIE